jgi:HPt (histidine-containing phosphotransfer) domain-containing protein
VIALTANAVVGMREIFIEKGFDDFLTKPIDVSRLDEILARWIPKEKREQKMGNEVGSMESLSEAILSSEQQSPLPAIPGVNIQQGITMTGGTLHAYRQVIALFRQDAEDRLPLLQAIPETDALPSFVTQVHALKSASASIGAAEVSALAAGLEAAGKAGDAAFIQENLPVFAKCLAELAKGIQAWENAVKERDSEKQAGGLDRETALPLLRELAAALQSQKANDIDYILEQLIRQPLEAGIKATLEEISDEVLMAEYGKASEILEKLFLQLTQG